MRLACYVLAALWASNFAYQAMTNHDWSLAVDRSFFQFSAIMIFVLMRWIGPEEIQ